MEDDTILGTSIVELVNKMAKSRNVKEDALKKLGVSGDGLVKAQKIKDRLKGRDKEGDRPRSGICLPTLTSHV